MAPSKSPVFAAVCGGISVDAAISVERRGTSLKTRRSPDTGLAESLYVDLLWECGGGNVDEDVAEAAVFGSGRATAEDYGDVFGGPPKFASFSSQLSLKRGKATASPNGIQEFHVFASKKAECTPLLHEINSRQGACTTGEAFGVPESDASSFSSIKLSKLRSSTEAPVSLQSCYSDDFTKDGVLCRGGETSATTQRPGMKSASTLSRRKEFSKSDRDVKVIRTLKPARKGLATMKENIQVPLKGIVSEHELCIPTSTSDSSIQFPEGSQMSTCSAPARKADAHRHNVRVKKQEKVNDSWVTVKDFEFATEPSAFPPPSRPPPGPTSASCHNVGRTDDNKHNIDDWSNQIGQEGSASDSGSFISSCTQQSSTRRSFKSEDVTDAIEMAEVKLRMVLEAREKAKRMVEMKLKEKQRARQHKESNRSHITELERPMKDHIRDYRGRRETSRARYCEENHSKQEVEDRKWDKTRERVNGHADGKYGGSLRERARELLALHHMSERLVQEGTLKVHLKSGIGGVSPRANDFCATRTKRDLPEGCVQASMEGPDNVVVKDGAFDCREQQQAGVCSSEQRHSWTTTRAVCPCSSPSSGCYDTEWRSVIKRPSFEIVGSMPILDIGYELLSGSAPCLVGFKEIVGEVPERRKARWDRHCRTAERMTKALEEKKQRDIEWQKEQMERHKAGEVLDEQIKHWASGKEGNLEALLCSLHNVLWPECGWERVLPADLLTAAAVKKAYRRATLCLHPDKVQQKGSTITQKYIAEKVFDLLKDAWVKSL